MTTLWPFVVYFFAVIILAAGMIGLSYFLGERHKDRQTGDPFEAGMMPTGSARLRFDIKFYLIAAFFVIFDLESMFIFAWAVAARQVGWAGYIEILIFIGILVVALIYLWRLGALDWSRRTHRQDVNHKGH